MGSRFRVSGWQAYFFVSMIWHLRVAPYYWWLRRTGQQEKQERLMQGLAVRWSRSMLRALGCEVVVEGAEHMPASGPVVVMSNHQGLYDIPLLMGFLGRLMGFVAKESLFRIPVLSFWMRQIHCVSLDRTDPRAASALYERLSADLMDAGRGFILFPEGTRSRHPEGEMGPFRQGAVRMVMRDGLPILPLVLDGTRYLTRPDAMARSAHGGRLIRLRLLPVRYASPRLSAPERRAFMEDLRAELVRHREEIKVQWPADATALQALHPPVGERA